MTKTSLLLLFLLSALGSFFVQAQDLTIQRKKDFNLSSSGVAINGYDPVSYFFQNKAIEGERSISFIYQGVIYYFSTLQNKEEFKKNPSKFEPQYGGWCAYAMGEKGEKVEIDPETFKILGGKLYLFYNKYFNNTLNSWNKNESNLKKNADANWIKLMH